jgi:L-2-hydroxyglutarate oxidase LhgO
METFRIETAVIGAGVVGLAIARALGLRGREVMIFEARGAFGEVSSARNSEVIHAGMYYAPGSLRAWLCVRGKHQLYDYCASRGVGHKRIGKLIVASEESEVEALAPIMERGVANGVDDLELLDGADAMSREPDLRAVAAIWSPSTGIIDSHGLMLSILGEAEAAGARLVCRAPVTGGALLPGGTTELFVTQDGETVRILADRVINSAGLGAQGVARAIDGFPAAHIPKLFMSKGQYFAMTGASPFKTLIYPTPHAAALGIHLTLDLAGQARFGPDHHWVEEESYDVNPADAEQIYEVVRRYYPGLRNGSLHPDYAGIRCKTQGPGDPPQDWKIFGPETHGVANHVHLFGMESPALTSCLAIADYVTGLLD